MARKDGETPREDVVSHEIIHCAIEVHRTLGGPGLLECVCEEALAWELDQAGLQVQRQAECPINYKGRELAQSLRIDLIVGDCVIVECKATTQYHTVFEAQTLTYSSADPPKTGACAELRRTSAQGRHSSGCQRPLNGEMVNTKVQ